MLIEEILPINYYNQLIGILVDTTILKILIKKLMPKLSIIIENNKDHDGNFIGDIFINKILINLFVNKAIDKNISLLIFDYLFLKGNKIIFQAFLSIYHFLSDLIIKCDKNIESFNQIITEDIKQLNINNENFLSNLFFIYEKAISNIDIDELRNTFSLTVAQTLEDKNIEYIKSKVKLNYNPELYEKQMDKFKNCHKEWPYCISDSYFENVTRIIDHLSFSKGTTNYIDNYFFSNKLKKGKDQIPSEIDENKCYNIILDRRPHYCSEIQDEMNSIIKEKEKKNHENKSEENDIKEEMNEIHEEEKEEEIHDKIEIIKNTMTTENFLNISKAIEEKINDDIFIPNIDDQ